MSRILLGFAIFAFALSAPAPAQLSAPEQRMIATVDAEQERTVDMLAKWVNQNSGSLNSPGVEKVGAMLRSELEPLGFKVDWVDMKAANRFIVSRAVFIR
jgi:glutamate carboxypeptidase